jgi:hypothetical protein
MAYKNASFSYRVRRNNRKRPPGVSRVQLRERKRGHCHGGSGLSDAHMTEPTHAFCLITGTFPV